VDDNLNNLNILSHFLTQSKIRCHTLTKGKDVIPTMEKELESGDPFDLCVLDIQMPRMSGYEVAKQVRQQQNQQIANMPLLAFSSSVSKRSKVSREVGFDGFLPKPIQRSSFLKMIKRLLGEEEKAAQEREKDPIITQHTLKEEAKHTLTILLAEDNLVNQKLALFMLTKAGYKVEIANNGQEAVDKLSSDPDKYNLIFMDVNMPELDGLEATQKIRELGYKQIPIIAMTAAAMQEDRDMCLKSGMNDYIPKPIKRELVFSMVEKYVMKK
jgi:CheY-like chemotaxis protein